MALRGKEEDESTRDSQSFAIQGAEVKVVQVSQKMLDKAVRLHGHLGPFLVLGLKMSSRAKKILREKPEKCEVETTNSKPFLCVVDGIKAVIGSDAVTVREGNGLSAKFSKAKDREVIVKVKEALVEKYAEGPWEKSEEYAYEVIQSDDEQLFE
jgi:formylmethanofuran dehydrogenase subunit E